MEETLAPNFISDKDFVADSQAPAAPQMGAPTPSVPPASMSPDFIPDNQFVPDSETYGTLEQQAKAGLEGAARGASFGLSDLAETTLGLTTPEALKARREENPWTAGIGTFAGALAPGVLTGGLSEPIEGAMLGEEALNAGRVASEAAEASGATAAQAARAARAATIAEAGAGRAIAARLVSHAAEGAVFGAGNAVTDYAMGDPHITAGKILGDVGMGALIGTAAGALSRGIESFYSAPEVLKNPISDNITDIADKTNQAASLANTIAPSAKISPDVIEAANRLNLPVPTGLGSQDPFVQRATDSLIHGAPTFAGIATEAEYANAFKQVSDQVQGVLGDKQYTKAQLGNLFKTALTGQVDEANGAFNNLYDAIKQVTGNIPVTDEAKMGALDSLDKIEIPITSSANRFVKMAADEIMNAENADQLKQAKSTIRGELNGLVASGNDKYVVGRASDVIETLLRDSVTNEGERLSKEAADPAFREQAELLLKQKKATDSLYKSTMEKFGTLSEQLGKRRVNGLGDIENFISELDPEQITQKIFSKKSSEFNSFLEKKFPQLAALNRQYQKANLRQASTAGDLDSPMAVFSPRTFFNKISAKAMEPEIKAAIFSPDEISKLKDAETYIKGFPKDLNPPGTSHTSALRAFFESPLSSAAGNLRDFGIRSYIQVLSKLSPGSRPNPAVLGTELADKFNQFTAAQKIGQRFDSNVVAKTKNIFDNGTRAAGAALTGYANSDYDKNSARVKEFAQNPELLINHLASHTAGINRVMPNVSQAIQSQTTMGLQFLNSKIPQNTGSTFLSSPKKASSQQRESFNRYYQAVNEPASALDQVKEGNLTSQTMEALNAVHPNLLADMRKTVVSQLNPEKVKDLSYDRQIALAKFLGQPLDQNMLPAMILKNQQTMAQPSQSKESVRTTKGGLEDLKIANRKATVTQELEEEPV